MTTLSPAIAPNRMLRLHQVSEIVSLSRASIYRLIAEGRFPPPVRIGLRAVAWDSAVISAWINALASHPPECCHGHKAQIIRQGGSTWKS